MIDQQYRLTKFRIYLSHKPEIKSGYIFSHSSKLELVGLI